MENRWLQADGLVAANERHMIQTAEVDEIASAITDDADMLTDVDKEVIRRTWRLLEPIEDTTVDLFYRRLFELRPDLRSLFKENLAAQKRKLLATLRFVVRALNWPSSAWRQDVCEADDLFLVVLALGRRHRELYHVPDDAYNTVGEALLWALDYGLGEAFDDEAQQAWRRIYTLLATTMKMGKGASELGTPVIAPDTIYPWQHDLPTREQP